LAAIVFLSLVVLVGSGCDSGGSSSSGSSYTSGGAAFKSVSDALTGAEGMIDTSLAPSSLPGKVSTMTSGLSAKWEVSASYNNPKYDSTSCPSATSMITLKEYMGTQFDNNQKRCNGSYINIFGRLENAGGMLCIIMNSLNATTSAELVSAADASVTFTSAVKSDLATKCPSMASSLNNESEIATDSTATLQFDAPAVTTTYDLKITIQPFNSVVFVKYGGTEINFAVNEDNTNGNHRTLVSYDTSTKILRAEYASKSKGSSFPLYIHRLYKDETNSLARIVSSIQTGFSANTDTSAGNIETYVISGQKNCARSTLRSWKWLRPPRTARRPATSRSSPSTSKPTQPRRRRKSFSTWPTPAATWWRAGTSPTPASTRRSCSR
jgi:hypothetical protein